MDASGRQIAPLNSTTALHGELHLGSIGQPKFQAPTTAVGQHRLLLIELVKLLSNDPPQLRRVIHPGQQVHHDLLGMHFQNPAGLRQLPELIVIVAVIVVSPLEGRQCRIENIGPLVHSG